MRGHSSKGLAITTFMMLILILVLTVGSLVFVLFGNANESAKQRGRLTAEQIAGIINIMEASPSPAFHVLELSDLCTIDIDAAMVRVTMDKKVSVAGIIQNGVDVTAASLACEKTGKLYFMRCRNSIEISEKWNNEKWKTCDA